MEWICRLNRKDNTVELINHRDTIIPVQKAPPSKTEERCEQKEQFCLLLLLGEGCLFFARNLIKDARIGAVRKLIKIKC